jgi:hypothetical protein
MKAKKKRVAKSTVRKVGARTGPNPYKVDVAGSTPALPTTLKVSKNNQRIEIPKGWELHQTFAFENLEPVLHVFLRRTDSNLFENHLKSKRAKRSA